MHRMKLITEAEPMDIPIGQKQSFKLINRNLYYNISQKRAFGLFLVILNPFHS